MTLHRVKADWLTDEDVGRATDELRRGHDAVARLVWTLRDAFLYWRAATATERAAGVIRSGRANLVTALIVVLGVGPRHGP